MDALFRVVFAALSGLVARTGVSLPRVRKVGDQIIARSPVSLGLLTLGACYRRMTLDLRSKYVRVADRRAWFFRWSRVFTFDQIQGVEYGYWNINEPGLLAPSSTQDYDNFVVALRLVTEQSVTLFSFRGGGSWSNNGILPDWCYWEDNLAADLSAGGQEGASRLFAEVLSSRIGVPLMDLRP